MNREKISGVACNAIGWLLRGQFGVLLLLLVISPYAMSFLPFEGIQDEGVWNTDHRMDPDYSIRVGLIMFGIIASVLCIILAIITSLWSRRLEVMTATISCTILAFDIGWRLFPYWVAGIFRVTHGTVLTSIYDPTPLMTALIPTAWICRLWYHCSIYSFIVYLVCVPLLILASIVAVFKRRGKLVWFSVAFILLLIVAHLSARNYYYWLMD